MKHLVLAALLGLLSACAATNAGGRVHGAALPSCARPPTVFVSREYFVFFDKGLAAITPRGLATIKEVSAALKDTDGFTVELEGHADPAEARTEPRMLAYARALAVRSALLAENVLNGRITPYGFGTSRMPMRAEPGAEEMLNRHVRVDIVGSQSRQAVRQGCRALATIPA